MDAIIDKFDDSQRRKGRKFRLVYIFKEMNALWNLVMLILSIGGLFVVQYLFYPIMLLDIIVRFPALGNMIKAIRLHGKTLVSSLLFLMIVIFLYSVSAFAFFNQDF